MMGRYNGYLLPWVKQIIALRLAGLSPTQIAEAITPAVLASGEPYPPQASTINYVLDREGTLPPGFYITEKQYREARQDHAAFLRLEGLTYQQIADRLGMDDKGYVSALVRKASERWARGLKRARFRFE